MAQLDHAFWPRDVPQLVAAQIGQPRSRRQVIDGEFYGRGGQDGLTAVRQVAHARGPVDGWPDVVAFIAQPDLRCVDRFAA